MNKDETKEYQRQWYLRNKAKKNAQSAANYAENRDVVLERQKERYQNNRDQINAKARKVYAENSVEVLEHHKKYNSENRLLINKNKRKYQKVRYRSDPNYRLARLLRSRINSAVKNNTKVGSAVSDLGCSVEDLKKRFEMIFLPGMSWENHGEWQIDHIRPLASFDLTDREQFLEAVCYLNLQPLWAEDNMRKGDTYEH